MFHAVSHFPLMRRRWAQAKRDLRLWQYAPVSPLPCHVLNRECADISIMSKMSTVGAGVRAGSILWEGWWGGGGEGEGQWASTTGLHHSWAPLGLWSMCGWLSSPVFILWGEWGCCKWDFGGLGGRRHHLNGVMRLVCVEPSARKRAMISALSTGTQAKIKTAIGVSSQRSKKTYMKVQWVSLCYDDRASIPFCQINVALLRGPLVDYLLAGASMGRPPAPNDHSDVRYWHKIAWKWWCSALKFQSAHFSAQ